MLLGMAPATDDLLTPAEVARLCGVSAQSVTRWTREGKLACIVTVGGHRRFRRADVDALLAKDAS